MDSLNYQNDNSIFRHGSVIVAYNNVIYQLKRALRTDNAECEKRFKNKKKDLETQIRERGVYKNLSGHLKDCFGVDDISGIPMPENYSDKDEVHRRLVEEENSSLFGTQQRYRGNSSMSGLTSEMKSVHDATLGLDDKCIIVCYD